MDDQDAKPAGSVIWLDLTSNHAPMLRDFYASVVGWRAQPVDMGEYSDFMMIRPDGTPAAGICHARGANADMPAMWLPYVVVDDVEKSSIACVRRGGTIITESLYSGDVRYCVIRDPAGAFLALIEGK